MTNLELYHYGIKNMKWGKRRYQNKDGSLTTEGKRRYYGQMYNDDKFDPAREKAKEKLRELHEKGKENLTLKPKSKEQYDYYGDRPDALSREELEARKKEHDLSNFSNEHNIESTTVDRDQLKDLAARNTIFQRRRPSLLKKLKCKTKSAA